MSHDQLFKAVLRAFFREFVELFFPDVAARLDFSRVTFLDKELFTDLPEGEQRETDLVAQVVTLDGLPEVILVHIEVESQRRSTFPARMFEYFMLLRLRHKVLIFPIVIYLSPGAGGLVTEQYNEHIFTKEVVRFFYSAVGLPDLSADDYQGADNPLGTALSALMKASQLGRVVQKYQSLRKMAQSQLDEARKALLANLIETYLPLQPAEQAEFGKLAAQPEAEELRAMMTIYEQRGIEKGIEQGIEKGIEQGIEMGILSGKIDALLQLMARKFGDLSAASVSKVRSLSSVEEVDSLFDKILSAATLEDMGIQREEGEKERK